MFIGRDKELDALDRLYKSDKQKEYQQYGICIDWRLLHPGSEASQ